MFDNWSLPDLILVREAYNDMLVKLSDKTLATPSDHKAWKELNRCLEILSKLNQKIEELEN